MQANTRNPLKLRHHNQDGGSQRQPRPAARRQGTRAAQIRAAMREA